MASTSLHHFPRFASRFPNNSHCTAWQNERRIEITFKLMGSSRDKDVPMKFQWANGIEENMVRQKIHL